MTAALKTTELQRNDVVRCVGGRDDGRLFRITSADGTHSIGVHLLTKSGARDRRYGGWTGHYADCGWELVSREPAPEPPPLPAP